MFVLRRSVRKKDFKFFNRLKKTKLAMGGIMIRMQDDMQGWGRLQKPDYDYSAHKIIDYDYSGD